MVRTGPWILFAGALLATVSLAASPANAADVEDPTGTACASVRDDARCDGVAASGTGAARGFVAVSGGGPATGYLAVSGTGDTRGIHAVSLAGDAHGIFSAASLTGDAQALVLSASGTGNASCRGGILAIHCTAWSATGDARCTAPTCLAVSGTGHASGCVAASGTGGADASCEPGTAASVCEAGREAGSDAACRDVDAPAMVP